MRPSSCGFLHRCDPCRDFPTLALNSVSKSILGGDYVTPEVTRIARELDIEAQLTESSPTGLLEVATNLAGRPFHWALQPIGYDPPGNTQSLVGEARSPIGRTLLSGQPIVTAPEVPLKQRAHCITGCEPIDLIREVIAY